MTDGMTDGMSDGMTVWMMINIDFLHELDLFLHLNPCVTALGFV